MELGPTTVVYDVHGSAVRLRPGNKGMWFIGEDEDGDSDPVGCFDREAVTAIVGVLSAWLADPLTADRGQSDDGAEPCGSRRVLETTVAWCGRTDGPCPYPGTPESRGGADRKCADSPGRRLSVVYADDVLLATRRALRQTIGDDAPPFPGVSQDVIHVALAALDACIGDDDGHIAGGEDPGR